MESVVNLAFLGNRAGLPATVRIINRAMEGFGNELTLMEKKWFAGRYGTSQPNIVNSISNYILGNFMKWACKSSDRC